MPGTAPALLPRTTHSVLTQVEFRIGNCLTWQAALPALLLVAVFEVPSLDVAQAAL